MSRKGRHQWFRVLVHTADATLEFSIQPKTTGQELFDLVVRTTGLRETWFFDLCYENTKGRMSWLKREKKVLTQDVPHIQPLPFHFKVKYYPEDVTTELIQPVTQNLFYLHVKQMVLDEELWCKAEHCVVLASFAVQATFGDYDPELCPPGFLHDMRLLPERILNQYQMTPEMWEERIVECYKNYRNMFPEEAKMKYLAFAQDFEMYGVNYFPIKNKRGTLLWLGVDALGLNIYKSNDKLTPSISFPWSEIKTVSYNDRKFVIKPLDKHAVDLVFFSTDPSVNKTILQLCIGNHELYLKRREPDSIEVQQMRAEAAERRERMDKDRGRLIREMQSRKLAEREKDKMSIKLKRAERKAAQTKQDLSRMREAAQILSEKVEMAEVETGLLLAKAQEAETTLQQMLHEKERTEQEKQDLVRQARDAKESAQRCMLNHSCCDTCLRWRCCVAGSPPRETEPRPHPQPPQRHDSRLEAAIKNISMDLEGLQIADRKTTEDQIHEQNAATGETKYDTLSRITRGSAKSRITFFEEL
ncbi:moesin [Salpingoeca rosetta]|uniref:Moesin n=1 Tax=Salpingoeca rosetta (strain ATCC 50818 / BSB-021) TaxID=946362 RepID=F2UG77_SALR5|nr:moesin [Salpingoeca rosetta]EGD75505.1 moesin [Salpingoeca rosetta]|eukprot:XP_004991962.1 moesin [Salpingoeca rosetta]